VLQWNGKGCDKKEKWKALEMSRHIRDEEREGAACKLLVFNEGTAPPKFWDALGGKQPVPAAIDDAPPAAPPPPPPRLVRVSDETGAVSFDEVAQGSLASSMLDSADVFIVDGGEEVFVWVGKAATARERRAGMAQGVAYSVQSASQGKTPVTKFVEGMEPAAFEACFAEWTSSTRQPLLFGVSDATGALEVFPIAEWAQRSLEEEDAFLLDTFDALHVWVGSGATRAEAKGAVAAAKQRVASLAHYAKSTPVIEVSSGVEPDTFTKHFAAWDRQLKTFGDPFKVMREEGAKKGAAKKAGAGAAKAANKENTADRAHRASMENRLMSDVI